MSIRQYLDIVRNPATTDAEKIAETKVLQESLSGQHSLLDDEPLATLMAQREDLADKIQTAFEARLKQYAAEMSQKHPEVIFEFSAGMGAYGIDLKATPELDAQMNKDDAVWNQFADLREEFNRPPFEDDWSELAHRNGVFVDFFFTAHRGQIQDK